MAAYTGGEDLERGERNEQPLPEPPTGDRNPYDHWVPNFGPGEQMGTTTAELFGEDTQTNNPDLRDDDTSGNDSAGVGDTR